MDINKQRELAIHYHATRCHANHIDQCGWTYEIRVSVHDWNASSHYGWFQKVPALIDADLKAVQLLNGVIGTKAPAEVVALRKERYEAACEAYETASEAYNKAYDEMCAAKTDWESLL